MTKLDAFNLFLRERFIVVAEEIFHAVQDIVLEQQEEIKRAKEEIYVLRRVLEETRLENGTDAQSSHPERPSLEQQKSQKQPLNPEPSVIQVKLEVCAVQNDEEPQLQNSSSSSTQATNVRKSTQSLPSQIKENEVIKMNSYISVDLVHCDAQLRSGSLNSGVVRNQAVSADSVEDFKEEDLNTCPYCNSSFNDFLELATHLESHSTVKDPFHCEICGKNFKHRVTWKNHMIVHQKLRPFRCNFCNKGFNQKGHLKEHERIHTGEKPFSCSICGKRFTQYNHVKVHVRNHHSNEVR